MSTERGGGWLWVALLCVFALGVRLTGIDYGVPIWEEPDPDIPIHVDLLRDDMVRANRELSERQYPHLVAHLVSLLPARPQPGAADAPSTVEEHLAYAAHTHVQSRRVVALLSVLLLKLAEVMTGPGIFQPASPPVGSRSRHRRG